MGFVPKDNWCFFGLHGIHSLYEADRNQMELYSNWVLKCTYHNMNKPSSWNIPSHDLSNLLRPHVVLSTCTEEVSANVNMAKLSDYGGYIQSWIGLFNGHDS